LLNDAFCVWEPVKELKETEKETTKADLKKRSSRPSLDARSLACLRSHCWGRSEDQIDAVFKSHLIEEDYHYKH